VKSIGDLKRVRSTLLGCFRIDTAAIAADNLDSGVLFQPGLDRLSGTVWQEINDSVFIYYKSTKMVP
jgi:hypothetical protein